MSASWRLTALGGPTILIQWHGLNILTDPTFDPAGSEYSLGPVTLRKTIGPALTPEQLPPIDLVLLSHDEHADNLDRTGREFLARVPAVVTTVSGARRLGPQAVGLEPGRAWQYAMPSGEVLSITATPARHGPPGCEPVCGDVIGFIVRCSLALKSCLYISGDTVWYDDLHPLARNYSIDLAILFAGAARLKEIGPDALTMTSEDCVAAARSFSEAVIIPAHYSGWEHFSEGRHDLEQAFDQAGLSHRLAWLPPGTVKAFAVV